jgi:predicted nucleotidyltransferase
MAGVADLEVARQLKERILAGDGQRVSKVILFGSRARGDARPDSDYDLLVVFRHLPPGERRASRVRLYGLLRGAEVPVEPHVMSDEEFEDTKGVVGGLAYPAAPEGVLLYPDT